MNDNITLKMFHKENTDLVKKFKDLRLNNYRRQLSNDNEMQQGAGIFGGTININKILWFIKYTYMYIFIFAAINTVCICKDICIHISVHISMYINCKSLCVST